MVKVGALGALLLLGCANVPTPVLVTSAPTTPGPVTIFIHGDLRGSLGPCGCSEHMRGGLSRFAHLVAEARDGGATTLVFDTGNSLFDGQPIPDDAVAQQERKAVAIAEVWRGLGLSGRSSQPADDARGAAFRSALKLPQLPSGAPAWFDSRAGRIAVIDAASAESLRSGVSAARAQGAAFVLGIFHTDFSSSLREGSGLENADLIVVAPNDRQPTSDRNARTASNSPPMVMLESKGRSVLEINLQFGPGERFRLLESEGETQRRLAALSERIELNRAELNAPGLSSETKALRAAKLDELLERRETLARSAVEAPPGERAFSFRFVPVESNIPDEAQAARVVRAYDEDVGRINVAEAKRRNATCPPAPQVSERYAGSASCAECHDEEVAFWRKTKHASSLAALVGVGKQHHLDCIGCHVTAWKQPSGPCRIDQLQAFDHVGCEACHGPGAQHVESPEASNIGAGTAEETCRKCHDPDNSPHFKYATYRAQVVGVGHQRMATQKVPKK